MTSYSTDDQLDEEQSMFPYLLTLEKDTELPKEGPLEEMVQPEIAEEAPPQIVAPEATAMTRVNPTPNLTTNNNPSTTISTTLPTTAIPIVINLNTENHNRTEETISALRDQLTTVQKELADLRQSTLEQGVRLQTLEFNWKQLRFLCPTLGDMIRLVEDSITPPQQEMPTPKSDGPNFSSPKKNKNENPNDDTLVQPQAKRAKKIPTPATTYLGKHPFCPSCNHHHKGPCPERACFKCKKTGHLRDNCPQKGTSSSPNLRLVLLSVERHLISTVAKNRRHHKEYGIRETTNP